MNNSLWILPKMLVLFLIYLPLLFLFLQSFYIPGTNIPFYDIIIGISLFLLILIKPRNFIIFFTFKEQFYKVLWIYIAWIFVSGILLIFLGIYKLHIFLYATIALFFYNNICWYIYPTLLISHFISLRNLIRYLLICIYLICLYGLLVFLLNKINLHILDPIQNIIVNRRELISTTRVLSVFEEPGYMGGFICINIPIVYNIILSKFKVFYNKYINCFFKKSFIPLYIITLILVQSPIWLIIFIIINLIYFHKIIFKHFKSILIMIFTLIICTNIVIKSEILHINDNSRGVLTRIINFTNNFGTNIVFIDESLATRILGYKARFKIFLKHPITGVGYKNTEYHVYKVLEETNTILPTGMRKQLFSISNNDKFIMLSGSILWNALSDTGIVGMVLFYTFLILSMIKLNVIQNKVHESMIKKFIIGLNQTYLAILCLSIYDIRSNFTYFWFLFGMTIPCVLYYDKIQKSSYSVIKEELNNEYK